jgi:hypothetical protein
LQSGSNRGGDDDDGEALNNGTYISAQFVPLFVAEQLRVDAVGEATIRARLDLARQVISNLEEDQIYTVRICRRVTREYAQIFPAMPLSRGPGFLVEMTADVLKAQEVLMQIYRPPTPEDLPTVQLIPTAASELWKRLVKAVDASRGSW